MYREGFTLQFTSTLAATILSSAFRAVAVWIWYLRFAMLHLHKDDGTIQFQTFQVFTIELREILRFEIWFWVVGFSSGFFSKIWFVLRTSVLLSICSTIVIYDTNPVSCYS